MYDFSKVFVAKSVEDAIKLLTENPKARIIAGGSDVLIKTREGKFAGCELVSIQSLDELRGIKMEDDGTIVIGPLTSFSHITQNEIIKKHIPTLGWAVDQVGGPQIRNIGTIGGNICNGATSADSAATVFALGVDLKIAGPNGTRMVNIEDFYAGPGKVKLEQGEILVEIRVPKKNYENFGGHYTKYAMRNALDIATLSCTVMARLNDAKDTLEEVKIAYGVAAPTPVRCHKTEDTLKGMKVCKETIDKIGELVLEEINPRDSWRASKVFRIQIAKEIAKRGLANAIRRAGGVVNE